VGLSGVRRLRHGPLRDTVLEVRFVTGDGRLVKGGGPTVKNVTGYDLPRLLVGSFGTLGVLTRVTLRCRPQAAARVWMASSRSPGEVLQSLFRPSAVLHDGNTTFVLLEGVARDIDAQAARGALGEPCDPPAMPTGAHRGRVSVAPGALDTLAPMLRAIGGCRWTAEYGVGTVHVAGDDANVLLEARAAADSLGGWLLREAGGGDAFDGFGHELPNRSLQRRIKDAFDPGGRCNPGRLPQ
jgi:glycolate oxidase FAD binding subunit